MKNTWPALFLFLLLCSPANADLTSRWTTTATDTSLSRGDAATITWGIVGDGTFILGVDGEPSAGSDLIVTFDNNLGSGGGGSDLTNRPWYVPMEAAFDRWGELTGATFNYESNDDGVRIWNTDESPGVLGTRADIRIGGKNIDGNDGRYTFNYTPNHGDMVIDSADVGFFNNNSNNFERLRNTMMRSIGEGLGLSTITSTDSEFLMEAGYNSNIDGPQLDDILTAQRGYGDVHEKNGGNDTASNATDLGTLADGGSVSIGNDATDATVAATDTDFISIDGDDDNDFLKFTIDSFGVVDLVLNPLGPTYNKNGSSFDASSQSDLILELFDTDGTSSLGIADNNGLGGSESLLGNSLNAGTYFVKVSGKSDAAQFYGVNATFSAVPEPNSVFALGVLSLAGAYLVRRRNKRATA